MVSSLYTPEASVHVKRIFASVGNSVGGVYVAALRINKATNITPTSAPRPAIVGVPSLIKRGILVSLIPLSCISLSNSL